VILSPRRSPRGLWPVVSYRGEDDDGDLPAGVTLVDVIAALRAAMDKPRQSPVLAVGESPEFVAFIARGDPRGCARALPPDLNVYLRVGADVPVSRGQSIPLIEIVVPHVKRAGGPTITSRNHHMW